jgi:hypothetical protein
VAAPVCAGEEAGLDDVAIRGANRLLRLVERQGELGRQLLFRRGRRRVSVSVVEFDAAAIVLFAEDFEVWRAARIPVDVLRNASRFSEHVRGGSRFRRNELLDQGEDWTDRLHAVTV